MTLISGAMGTGSIPTEARKYSVSDKLWEVDPDYAAVAFFARKLNKQAVTDPEYRWFEITQPSRQDAVNYATNYTSGATEIVVDDSSKFRVGDVVVDTKTSEHLHVTTITSGTHTLTVTRAYGTTSATTITDNDVLVILGNANAEGATSRTALTNAKVKKANYTQIFREPFEVTGTDESTEQWAGASDLATLRRMHLQLHMKDIERSCFFGEPKEDTSGTQPVRATGGANYFISSVRKSISTLTNAEWDLWIADVFAKGGDKKLAFISPLIGSAVNSWAAGKLQMFPKDKTFGISIAEYQSIHGTVDFVIEKLFKENTIWNGMAFAFDMERVGYRYLAGNGKSRDTSLLKNRQANDADGTKEEYLTEGGFFLATEARHAMMYGVTAWS